MRVLKRCTRPVLVFFAILVTLTAAFGLYLNTPRPSDEELGTAIKFSQPSAFSHDRFDWDDEFRSSLEVLGKRAFEEDGAPSARCSIPGRAIAVTDDWGRGWEQDRVRLDFQAYQKNDVTAVFFVRRKKHSIPGLVWRDRGKPDAPFRLQGDQDVMGHTLSVRVLSWPAGELLASEEMSNSIPVPEDQAESQVDRECEVWQSSLSWKKLEGRPPDQLLETNGEISQVLWSKSSRLLAVAHNNPLSRMGYRAAENQGHHTIEVWDASHWRILHRSLPYGFGSVCDLAFGEDGALLAGGFSEPGGVVVWNIDSGEAVRSIAVPPDEEPWGVHDVDWISILEDPPRVAAVSKHDGLQVWEIDTGKEVYTACGARHPLTDAPLVRPDCRLWVDPDCRLWVDWEGNVHSVDNGREICHLCKFISDPLAVAWSRDARLFCAAGASKPVGSRLPDGVVRKEAVQLWNVFTGDRIVSWEDFNTPCVIFDSEGRSLACSVDSYEVQCVLLNIEKPGETSFLPGEPLAFSPNSALLLTAFHRVSKDNILVWNANNGECVETLDTGGSMGRQGVRGARACAFSPDGNWVAFGDTDGRVSLWKMASPDGVLPHR